LLDQLLGYFRDVMAAAIGCPPDSFLNASPSEHAGIADAAKRLGLETILAMMQILDQTISRCGGTLWVRTLAELALVRIRALAISITWRRSSPSAKWGAFRVSSQTTSQSPSIAKKMS
jgi:hypothetical protein